MHTWLTGCPVYLKRSGFGFRADKQKSSAGSTDDFCFVKYAPSLFGQVYAVSSIKNNSVIGIRDQRTQLCCVGRSIGRSILRERWIPISSPGQFPWTVTRRTGLLGRHGVEKHVHMQGRRFGKIVYFIIHDINIVFEANACDDHIRSGWSRSR